MKHQPISPALYERLARQPRSAKHEPDPVCRAPRARAIAPQRRRVQVRHKKKTERLADGWQQTYSPRQRQISEDASANRAFVRNLEEQLLREAIHGRDTAQWTVAQRREIEAGARQQAKRMMRAMLQKREEEFREEYYGGPGHTVPEIQDAAHQAALDRSLRASPDPRAQPRFFEPVRPGSAVPAGGVGTILSFGETYERFVAEVPRSNSVASWPWSEGSRPSSSVPPRRGSTGTGGGAGRGGSSAVSPPVRQAGDAAHARQLEKQLRRTEREAAAERRQLEQRIAAAEQREAAAREEESRLRTPSEAELATLRGRMEAAEAAAAEAQAQVERLRQQVTDAQQVL